MVKPREAVWLLARRPPYWHPFDKKPAGEHALWWNVIRQACHDLRYGHRQEALDAIEFLRDTGLWLATELFGIDPVDYKSGVAALTLLRNRERGEHLYEAPAS